MPSNLPDAAASAFPPALHLPEPYASRVIVHYERVAPLLAASFAGTPLISVYYPGGFTQPETRVGRLIKPVPSHIATIPVRTRSGEHRYVALEANTLLWRVHGYAVEFETWSPTATNPLAVAFARILLVPTGAATQAMVKEGSVALRDVLAAAGLQAVPVLDGVGAALWVPFDDAPAYPAVRAWLHERIAEAAERHPTLFSIASGSEVAGRIHLSVRTNAPGQGSILPYSLRGTPDLPMATPVRWSELETLENGVVTATSSAARLDAVGDVFAEMAAAIDGQSFARAVGPGRNVASLRFLAPAGGRPIPEYMPRARVITVALQILADGRPRTAEEILDAALAKGLLAQPSDRAYLRKYIYVMLKDYAEKTKARGRKPLIVQDPDRRFHVDHAPDDWPDPATPAQAPAPTELIARLRAAAVGDDPVAFELAVCDAFGRLGFAATHVGGNMAPDGYIDAQLGPLGYRVMLECKTSSKALQRPDVFEAGKYREQYHARYCALIGPAFGDTVAITSELATHGVSAWTIDDIVTLLEAGSDPAEMQPLFEPGVVQDRLDEVMWQRDHGDAKRVAVVCDVILAEGWAAQQHATALGVPGDAPRLTEDAAMLLVDQHLSSSGSRQGCTRAQVRAAFEYLTNPRVRQAIWLDETRAAVVVVRP